MNYYYLVESTMLEEELSEENRVRKNSIRLTQMDVDAIRRALIDANTLAHKRAKLKKHAHNAAAYIMEAGDYANVYLKIKRTKV